MSDAFGTPGVASSPGSRWKKWTALGAAGFVLVGGLAAAGVGARWYTHTGDQPAEALPASTLGYLAVDLAPSGRQQLAAHSLLGKLPISDSDDLGSVGDLRGWVVDKILDDSPCRELSFDHDVAPWLGKRFAVAAVQVPTDGVQPAIVLQSSDDDRADAGMKKLSACGGSDFGGWKVADGWIVFAPSQDTADAVVKQAGDHALADDKGFQDTVEAAGGTGLVTGYASIEQLASLAPEMMGAEADALPSGFLDKLAETSPSIALSVHAEGDALRFAEAAKADGHPAHDTDVEHLLARIPSGSSAAVAFDLPAGISGHGLPDARDLVLDGFRAGAESEGGVASRQQAEAYVQRTLGAPLAQVVDDLLGSSLVAAVGPTEEKLPASPADVPLAAELVPAPSSKARVEGYRTRLEDLVPLSRYSSVVDDGIVFGTTADARAHVLSGRGLTESDRFRSVIDLDAHHVVYALYADLRSGLVKAALQEGLKNEDARWLDNLGHLQALGVTSWVEGGYTHVEGRLSVR